MKNVFSVIKRPIITEKGLDKKEENSTLCFEVNVHANKREVKEAVEKLFKVKVASVNTSNFSGKMRRRGKFSGYRPDWKKAYVTLEAGRKNDRIRGERLAWGSNHSDQRPLRFGSRRITTSDDITKDHPEKSLVTTKTRTGGRNSTGRLTVRHRGGGHKKLYRIIDFKRDKVGIPAKVEAIEYDPNRSACIALLHYADGEKRYILQPVGLQVGATIVSGPDADILVGNALPLKNIPLGTTIHNIEMRQGRGAQMARSAGSAAQLVAKEGDYAHVKMPSGEVRQIHIECMATIGQVGNLDHSNMTLGKAGRTRWLGKAAYGSRCGDESGRPSARRWRRQDLRGRHPVTPWGQPTRGYKTRNNKRTDQFIVKTEDQVSWNH